MPGKPHIVYILSDEHFGGAMSHAGDPNVRTPVMDRLASEGVSFSRAYANCPICTPSRGTIFSGRHAHAGPVQFFFDVYKSTAPSTATILREAGYHTAYIGKWHCGFVRDQRPPGVREHPEEYASGSNTRTPELFRAGFQDWYGFELNNAPFRGFYWQGAEIDPRKMTKYQTDFLTDLAIAYIKEYHRPEPLFLVLSVEPPHFPLQVPDEYRRLDPAELKVRGNFADSPEMRDQLAQYYGMVENLDANMGRLLAAIGEEPRFALDTLTVYTSDHGDHMGSHGTIKTKEHPHEESVRIPAVFHWPGTITASGTCPELLSLVDLLPTTLGLVGLPVPGHVQGTDFSPILRDEPFTGPSEVLLEMVGSPRWKIDLLDWRGLVTERWKYAFYETGHEILFDLESDPFELTNLAADEEGVRNEMRHRLLRLLAETREPFFDVVINHGAPCVKRAVDVSHRPPGGHSPIWHDGTVRSNNE